MTTRAVLAANVRRLMGASPGLATLPQITAAGGGSNGTLDRIRRGVSGTNIDNLEPLATVFGIEPWHLLMPTLEATVSGHTHPKISGVPVWPFSSELLAAVQALSPEDHLRLENVLRAYMGIAPALATDVYPQSNTLRRVAGDKNTGNATPALDRENERHASDEDGYGAVAQNRRGGRRRGA